MCKFLLTDEQWQVILQFLRQHPKVSVGRQRDCRCFVEAVLWILRSGSQWRLLPLEKGRWNSVFKRFSRWSENGVWADLFSYVSQDADLQHIMIGTTVVRAHACAAGMPKKSATGRRRSAAPVVVLALKSMQ